MKNLLIALLIIAPLLAMLPMTMRTIFSQQGDAEKVYYNLGVATIRLMDPSARKGVALEGAWELTDSEE